MFRIVLHYTINDKIFVENNRPDHDQQRSNRHAPTVETEAPSAVVRSWWWAGMRPKHVEPHINVK